MHDAYSLTKVCDILGTVWLYNRLLTDRIRPGLFICLLTYTGILRLYPYTKDDQTGEIKTHGKIKYTLSITLNVDACTATIHLSHHHCELPLNLS